MSTKLDIFAILSYLDTNNMGVYRALSEDEDMLKEFQRSIGWILPQWMSASVNDEDHRELLMNFNEWCNTGWFDLYYHPELQAKLLACCGLGKKTRHKFFKPKANPNVNQIRILLQHKYGDIRDNEVKLYCRKTSKAAIVRLAESLGYQKEQIKEVTKAFETLRKD